MFNQRKTRLGHVYSGKKRSSTASGYKTNTMMTTFSSSGHPNKAITNLALEGDFTFSGIEEESMESRSTSLLPSIAITHASPSRNMRTTSDSKESEDKVLPKKIHSQSNISSMLPSSSSDHEQHQNKRVNEDEGNQSLVENTPITSVLGSFKKRCSKSLKRNEWNASVKGEINKRQLSWKKDPLTESVSTKTMYFSGEDDIRKCIRGVVIPRLRDNFEDKNLESAYKKYSHRQRHKSLVILNVIDISLKVAFFFHLLIRIKETQGRIRIPVNELLLLIPWIVLNSLTIGLITCWKKCANHFLDYAALASWMLFTIETYFVFGSLFDKSLSGAFGDDSNLVPTSSSHHSGRSDKKYQKRDMSLRLLFCWETHYSSLLLLFFRCYFDLSGSYSSTVWYTMFTTFGIYSMMPLPLVSCVVCGSITCLSDLCITFMTAHVIDQNFSRRVCLSLIHVFNLAVSGFHFSS